MVRSVIPVTSGVLRPHLQELESRLRPGLVSLTWSSMNIDSFKDSAHSAIKVRVWEQGALPCHALPCPALGCPALGCPALGWTCA